MKRPDRCPCPCPGQALLLPPAPPGSAGHPLILFPLSACSVSNYSFGLKSSWSVTPCLMPCLNPWVHSGASPCFKELQTISTAKQQTLALTLLPACTLPALALAPSSCADLTSVVLSCQLGASQVCWCGEEEVPGLLMFILYILNPVIPQTHPQFLHLKEFQGGQDGKISPHGNASPIAGG